MIIYGKNVAQEIFKREYLFSKVQKIYIQPEILNKNHFSLPESLKNKVQIVEKKEIDRLAKGLHQGILLFMEDYQYTPLETVLSSCSNFLLILDHLEDPHNLGAILRTAAATKVDAIILPRDREVKITDTVMKTSAGTLYDTKIVEVTNLNQTIRLLKEQGYWIIGTAMNGTDYRTIDYQGKIAIVIGNEGKGMSPLLQKNCDFIASIPMNSSLDSLNVSVAAAIMMYEVVRNRK